MNKYCVMLLILLMMIVPGCNALFTMPDGTLAASGALTTCSEPFELTQDCSEFSGGARLISFNGEKFKIAGSSDGTIILIVVEDIFSTALKSTFGEGLIHHSLSEHNQMMKDTLEEVRSTMSQNYINISETIPLVDRSHSPVNPWTIYGYFVKLNSDGYAVLSKYSIEND